MIAGLLILACGALLLLPLENWIHRHLGGAGEFLAEHVYLPLARVLLIIGFLYAVFPTPLLSAELLQGLDAQQLAAPPLQSLINILFLISLIIPLFPETERFGGLIVPLQTLVGAWLFIGALEDNSGLSLRPRNNDWMIGFALALLISHFALRALARWLSRLKSWDALSVYDSLVMVCQPPLVLLVTRGFSPA